MSRFGYDEYVNSGGDVVGIAMSPGSEPLEGGEEALAIENMRQFVADLGDQYKVTNFHVERRPTGDEGGRYAFTLTQDVLGTHEIDMPGEPLDAVRYLGRPAGQDPWDYPRLYVDESSWLWKFALNVCGPEDKED